MNEIYPVPEEFKKTARTVEADYFKLYQHSIENPDEFWAEQAKIVDWIKPWFWSLCYINSCWVGEAGASSDSAR